jgi:hypothetical protein
VVLTASLPKIDEHQVLVDARPDQAWAAVLETFTGFTTRAGWRLIAKVLGCRPDSASGPPGAEGASVPGFRVTRSVAPTEWMLEGSHQFSRYSLTFRIAPLGGERCVIRAESSAAFPGPAGRAYRALVIGSGGHVLGVRSLLRTMKRVAERAGRSGAVRT